MLGFCFRVDYNIINIYHNVFSDHVMQDFLHESLEHAGRVAQSERHYLILVQPLVCNKRSFLYRVWVHRTLPVP